MKLGHYIFTASICFLLCACGPKEDPDPIAAAITKLEEGNFLSRRAAATDLAGMVGKKDTAAVPVLLEAFHDSNLEIRRAAAEGLGKIGDRRAVDTLMEGLGDENDYIRYDCALALDAFDLPRVHDALIQALMDQSSYVRWAAGRSLGELKVKKAVPDLISMLQDSSSYAQTSAAEALGKIGEPAAIPFLENSLYNRNLWVRNAAAHALGKMGERDGIPILIKNLKSMAGDRDLTVRGQAAEYLRNITGQNFNFDPEAPTDQRIAAIEKWEEWWSDQ